MDDKTARTQAERATLRAMLRWPETIGPVSLILKKDFFRTFSDQATYDVILDLWNQGKAIDTVTIANAFHNRYGKEDTPYLYLSQLAEEAVTSAHAEDHAGIV